MGGCSIKANFNYSVRTEKSSYCSFRKNHTIVTELWDFYHSGLVLQAVILATIVVSELLIIVDFISWFHLHQKRTTVGFYFAYHYLRSCLFISYIGCFSSLNHHLIDFNCSHFSCFRNAIELTHHFHQWLAYYIMHSGCEYGSLFILVAAIEASIHSMVFPKTSTSLMVDREC